jgi:glycosyltransferase 2 family protein
MRASLRSRLYWLGLGIGLIFFCGQVLKGYQVLSTLTLDISWLVRLGGAVLTGLVALGLQMLAWGLLMRDLGATLAWRAIAGGYMLAFLPRYIPGSVWGYLSRGEWLKRSHGVQYSLSGIGSIWEISAALVTGSAVIGFYYFLNTAGPLQFSLLCFEIVLPVLSWIILNFVFQLEFLRKGYSEQDLDPRKRVSLLVWVKVFVFYVMLWMCYGAMVSILMSEFGFPITASGLMSATFSFCASWLIGFLIIFFPSGLGVREFALSHILVRVMGIPLDAASAISVLTRLCIAFSEALWIVIGLIFSRRMKNTIQPNVHGEINPS